MKKNVDYKLKIPSQTDNLELIRNFVTGVANKVGFGNDDVSKIELAVDEACTNVIEHAYSGQEGMIVLVLELLGDDLIINIRDWGKPFDPDSVTPPDLEAELEERKIGGLGIHLMKKLMDEVSYSFDAQIGNTLTMRKRLLK